MGLQRRFAGRVPLQPAALDGCRRGCAAGAVEALSHERGGVDRAFAGKTCRQATCCRQGRAKARAFAGVGRAAEDTPGVWLGHHAAAVRLHGAPSPSRHLQGSAVLGHPRPDDRVCHQQRPLRRQRGRRERVAGDLPDAAGGRGLGDVVPLHRRGAVCGGAGVARA